VQLCGESASRHRPQRRAASAASHAPSRFCARRCRSTKSSSAVLPPNVTDIDRVTNPAASSSRRSLQPRPVRDRTRPRASRSRATRPELTFRFVSSSYRDFGAFSVHVRRHTASPGEDRGPALARGASGHRERPVPSSLEEDPFACLLAGTTLGDLPRYAVPGTMLNVAGM
jgi:hypothetical protein